MAKTKVTKLPNTNGIRVFMHCKRCLRERPEDKSPQEWRQLDVGFTKEGLQVWCTRHDMNVAHIHFEGMQHPANMTAAKEDGQAKLDDAFFQKVSGPMLATWSAIASDASQLEGRMTQAGAMELVLDADRMATYGGREGKAANDLVSKACELHGYDSVSRFLRRRIKFDL